MNALSPWWWLLLVSLVTSLSCRQEGGSAGPPGASSGTGAPSSGAIGPPVPLPVPRKGMAWIPGGALVVGTPPDLLPRKVDEEMPGEQVILHGYYIDLFPYPNEEGAIPLTNVSQPEAQALCAERGKRLCSELEWERACKGPDNRVYEYGDRHRADRCGTGVVPGLRPAGLRVGCRSDFGVRDLHGGAFEWTASRWGRGTGDELGTVRGGNATVGEIVGRCANGEGRAPGVKSGTVGFRCCAGEPNTAEVLLSVRHGKRLEESARTDSKLAARLVASLSEEARKTLAGSGAPRVERLWTWRPVGNEELWAATICAGLGVRPVCGVAIARDTLGKSELVAWAPSGFMLPSLHIDRDPRDVWLLGGDELGRYKRLIAYAWGRVTVHGEERRVGRSDPKDLLEEHAKTTKRSKGGQPR